MDLSHRFSVPTDVATTWSHFQDVGALAECFPGATVSAVEGDSFTGSAKVKLGPIALVYAGSGEFTERDETARRMVVEAKGKDKRGNGTAGATVTLTMTEAGDGTEVEVLTDLSVTGKPAQFGRGVMQDVSDKLLGQFVTCLEQRLATPATPTGGEPATVSAAATAADTPPSGESSGDTPTGGGQATGSPAETVAEAPPAAPPPPPQAAPPPPPAGDDAIDLGATVLPVLARTYWKPALAVVVALLVLRRLLSR